MKSGLNVTYIAEGLKKKLDAIPDYLVTTIIAAAGYGKTRAIRSWIDSVDPDDNVVLSMTVMRDSLSEFWQSFVSCFGKWPDTYDSLKALGFPSDAGARDVMVSILRNLLHQLNNANIYLVIEDLNFISDQKVSDLLMHLITSVSATYAKNSVRFVLASRNVIFNHAECIKLGADLNEITAKDLRLDQNGIIEYARSGGIDLGAEDAAMLERTTEGWFSVVYLNLSSWQRNHMWLNGSDSIYTIMDEVLFAPLSEREKDFLVSMSLPDEFSSEEAWRIWQEDDARAILHSLSSNNAFIMRLPDGIYRYHNMLKKCAMVKFNSFSQDRKKLIYLRLAKWYESERKLPMAEQYYRKAEAWDELLECFVIGQGRTVIGENIGNFLEWEKLCPVEVMMRHPVALLNIMKVLFSFGQIPEMMRIRGILDKVLNEDQGLSSDERDNLRGESELIMGFTQYNDIHAMSSFHRKAGELMTRFALNTNPKDSWTFGSPSVLWMFHRTPGGLDSENDAMFECMPYYYKCTNYHGNGAEYAMLSAICFMRGDIENAEKNVELTLASARLKGQLSIRIAAEFVLFNIMLRKGNIDRIREQIVETREVVKADRQYNLLYTMDLVEAWIESFAGNPDAAAQWLLDDAAPLPLPRPSAPMIMIVKNQISLAKGDYALVLARRIPAEKTCEALHACMCSIYLYIQLAVANEGIGQMDEAVSFLKKAVDLARPDGIIMPFALFGDKGLSRTIRELEMDREYAEYMARVKELTPENESVYESIDIKVPAHAVMPPVSDLRKKLTEKEYLIASLASKRKTNKEIAKELFLAEGTVRNQLSNVFNKLGIEGDTRNKRMELERLFK